MKISWLPSILVISFLLLAVQKSFERRSTTSFFLPEKVLKIQHFTEIKSSLPPKDQELFELWESMLTGRTAPLSRWIKERYKLLALNHLFTPSGFHLSAVLLPVLKLIKITSHQVILYIVIGCLSLWLPGMGALKRMILIKGTQKSLGFKLGFFVALLLDIMFGTFQSSTLSFTYSFLFLGLIYSGTKGIPMLFLLFCGQCLVAYFQGTDVSPLLILLSPIVNLAFGIAMPFLFLLALPMWNWQVQTALLLLTCLQELVDLSARIVASFPLVEVTCSTLLILVFLYLGKKRMILSLVLFFSGSLNVCQLKAPSSLAHEYRPLGEIIKVIGKESEDWVYFSDGKCKRRLVNGFWWERCSPKRKSTRNKLT